jgi:regulator of protease activity HflC (stomatin/prohibitin superfamily)
MMMLFYDRLQCVFLFNKGMAMIEGIGFGMFFGILVWFGLRMIATGLYTVDQSERAVVLSFGKAERLGQASTLDDPISQTLSQEERPRYDFPQLKVVMPGGPYFKWPWQRVVKVSIAIQTVSIGFDPDLPSANNNGEMLEAVTKDQLNTGLHGQIRFKVSEKNLYAYMFGVKSPVAHVMGYFISILRERIAVFEAPKLRADAADDNDLSLTSRVQGVSINDLRKNLSSLNQLMERECESSVARYGISLNAALITGIDPPPEVESALAAINTAHNQVSSEISLAQAAADQKIVQSRKAVEIGTMRAQAEVQMLTQLSDQLKILKGGEGADNKGAVDNYVRNVKLKLYGHATRALIEVKS